MRIPDLSVSSNVTDTIRDLNQQRIKLDKQISSGQKIALPEDDGMTMGRIIDLETQKSTLTQYQRNASYASEFLNTGHLNLDNLREVNVRGQEIARTASSGLSGSATQTYGHEINQMIEEVLNRLNASHRGRSLFGGTQLKPEFGNSDIQLGKRQKESFSFDLNQVGSVQNDGKRSINKGEQLVLELNGREYVVESKRDNLSSEQINDAFAYLINYDRNSLRESPALGNENNPNENLNAYVRRVQGNLSSRNENVQLSAEVSVNGNLEVSGTTGQTFTTKASFIHQWNPNLYFPAQIDDLLDKETENRFPGLKFAELSNSEQDLVRFAVFSSDRLNDILNRESESVDQYILALDDELTKILADETRRNQFLNGTNNLLSDYNEKKYLDLDAADQEKVRAELFEAGFSLEVEDSDKSQKTFADLTVEEAIVVEAKVFSQNWISEELNRESQIVHSKPFDDLTSDQQDVLRANIFAGYITRDLTVETKYVSAKSSIEVNHADDWRRLNIYELGDVIRHDGKLYESKIDNNRNHRPNSSGSDYWRELSSNYSREREDWQIENVGEKKKPYYMAADGKLFSSKVDAQNHAVNQIAPLLGGEVLPEIKQVFLSVDDFSAKGSNFDGVVTFDPETMEYRLSAVPDGGNVFEGKFIKGTVKDTSDPNNIGWENELENDQVIQHQGRYYLVTDKDNADPSTWSYLQASFPPQGVIHKFVDGESIEVNEGEYVLHGSDYYAATEKSSIADLDDLNKPELSKIFEHTDGSVFLLEKLPIDGEEVIYENSPLPSLKKGQYVFIPGEGGQNNAHYVALEDIEGPIDKSTITQINEPNSNPISLNAKFRKVDISVAQQGDEWSYDSNYQYGQIVFFEGKYFERIDFSETNFTSDPPSLGNENGSINPFKPTDEFILVDGKLVPNNSWREIDDFGKPLNHVLKFKSMHEGTPSLVLPDAGRAGTSAEARPIIDAAGNIAGIKLENPGRYFFGIDQGGAIPPDFSTVSILLDDGRKADANIIWGQDSADPGAYKIAGFSLNNQNQTSGKTHTFSGVDSIPDNLTVKIGDKIHDISNDRFYIATEEFDLKDEVINGVLDFNTLSKVVDFISGLPNGSDKGDSFSFSTGTKTFLDHRNENGEIMGVTYMGSESDSEFFIGKESKVSAFLSAENGATKQLSQTLDSLVTIRDGLLSENPSDFTKEMQKAEASLISHEDQIINQIGEITSNIVRMDTAKAHDEEYFMELDLRVSRDVDVDLSEAIMRLTRVSTAYQASLQIGSQLLNTSLLNYL